MSLDVQEKRNEIKEKAEKDKDKKKLKDMLFVRKALFELGEQYRDEIISKKVWKRYAAIICDALTLELEQR